MLVKPIRSVPAAIVAPPGEPHGRTTRRWRRCVRRPSFSLHIARRAAIDRVFDAMKGVIQRGRSRLRNEYSLTPISHILVTGVRRRRCRRKRAQQHAGREAPPQARSGTGAWNSSAGLWISSRKSKKATRSPPPESARRRHGPPNFGCRQTEGGPGWTRNLRSDDAAPPPCSHLAVDMLAFIADWPLMLATSARSFWNSVVIASCIACCFSSI